MDGARLILNARYFHIAQTGEKPQSTPLSPKPQPDW